MSELLKQVLSDLNKAKGRLETTYTQCAFCIEKTQYSELEIEKIEVLTARFARLIDLLVKRSYRAILEEELEEVGKLLDVLHSMEKRNLIDSVDQIRVLKDVRNQIAHDYAVENFTKLIQTVYKYVPLLLDLVGRVLAY